MHCEWCISRKYVMWNNGKGRLCWFSEWITSKEVKKGIVKCSPIEGKNLPFFSFFSSSSEAHLICSLSKMYTINWKPAFHLVMGRRRILQMAGSEHFYILCFQFCYSIPTSSDVNEIRHLIQSLLGVTQPKCTYMLENCVNLHFTQLFQ